MTVWEPIALHTTPAIPRYKQPEVHLVTQGVEYDVVGRHLPGYVQPNFCDMIRASPFQG